MDTSENISDFVAFDTDARPNPEDEPRPPTIHSIDSDDEMDMLDDAEDSPVEYDPESACESDDESEASESEEDIISIISKMSSTTTEQSAQEFADDIIQYISLGDIEVVSNTEKGGLVRFVPLSRKEDNKKLYVVMDSMKNQIYLKEKKIRYPSGKSYTKYTGRVKPDYGEVEVPRPENPKKIFMVDVFNRIRRHLIDELRGYIKVPEVADQTEYHMNIRHKFDRVYNILGYDGRVFTLKKGLASHILRDCTQRYVIQLEGVKITSDKVYLIMRLCRTVVDDEIVEQLRFHDAKLAISQAVNYKTRKNINRLRKTQGVNLKRRRFARKSDVARRLEHRVSALVI